MQQDCLTRLQLHDDDFRRQRLWQISRGQIVGLANPMLARDFRQYYLEWCSSPAFRGGCALRVQQEARISEHKGCIVRCHSRTNRSRRREAPQPCWFISGAPTSFFVAAITKLTPYRVGGGHVAELVGIEGGVVSGVINLESSGV